MSAIHGAGLSYPPFPKSAAEVKYIVFGIIQNQNPDLLLCKPGLLLNINPKEEG